MVAILCVLLSVVVRNAHKDFYEFGFQEVRSCETNKEALQTFAKPVRKF